jgi:hypothetical protein
MCLAKGRASSRGAACKAHPVNRQSRIHGCCCVIPRFVRGQWPWMMFTMMTMIAMPATSQPS